MSRLLTLVAAVVVALALSSGVASAAPINITVDSSGVLLNTIGIANDAQYGYGNNSPASNLSFLNDMIGDWNGVPLSPVMPAASPLALNQGSLGGILSYSGPAGFQYVVFHWGAGRAGAQGVSPGGWWSAHYLGGEAISFAGVPTVGGETVGGFSSANYFGAVPDGGMTVMLLGGALVGLGALRRKLRA
jgi:hypothetical protein